ncbi:MAG TPA: hypothetical protein VHO84_16570 [Syntrophorhabdaceae bacterium]|nr:hypothetical protein [Syntrophorhabdaceae bacterium]
MIGKLPVVSRLTDGRIFTVRRDGTGKPLPRILENDCWVEANNVSPEEIENSKPLSSEEVWELVSKGLLTR